MKKLIFIALMMVAFCCRAADNHVQFSKQSGLGTFEISKTKKGFEFYVVSVVEKDSCTVTGNAEFIADNRAAFTSSDSADQCAMVFNFKDGNNVKLTSKGCNNYCEAGAKGSMDGDYQRN